jgi:YVTN family beta-propeller protein
LIDVESLEEAHVISTGEPKPYAVAFSFDGSLIYVVHLGSSNISIMDGVKRKVTETLKLVDEPAPVVFNQRATRFYIGSRRSGGLSAVYTKTGKPINTVATKGGASELRFSPDFRDIWILGEAGLTVVDTKSNKVIKTMPLEGTNYRMAMDPDGKRVYLARVGDKVVSAIDGRSYQETAKISLNRPVHDLAISYPDGRYLWAADGDAVSAIDLTDNREVASIPVGKGPHRIAFVTIRRDMNFACFQ